VGNVVTGAGTGEVGAATASLATLVALFADGATFEEQAQTKDIPTSNGAKNRRVIRGVIPKFYCRWAEVGLAPIESDTFAIT
jgi:hypothetical protein